MHATDMPSMFCKEEYQKADRHSGAAMTGAFVLSILMGAIAAPTSAAEAADYCRPSINCIPNPNLADDVEDPVGVPDHWRTNIFGTSDAVFTTTAGRTDSRAATVTVTTSSGAQDAKWVFEDVPVVGGQYFVFGDWYKSSAPTEIYVFFQGGNTPYVRIMAVPPSESSDTWTQLTTPGFFVPAGATAMTVTHALVGAGTLTTDDHSLMRELPPVFRRGMVSLTFDDGWKSVYENAIPILNEAGIKSTQYIHTDPVILNPAKYARNVSIHDVLVMQSQGHEIGSHTRLHADLVDVITDEQARRGEIQGSRDDLLRAGIAKVGTFAYTFGKYNEAVRAIVTENYLGARTTDIGYNTTGADKFALKSQLVRGNTTADEINSWIDFSVANNFWLIISFHRVEPTLNECVDPAFGVKDQSCTDVATLQAVVDHLKSLPPGSIATIQDVLEDEQLWTPRPLEESDEAAAPPAGTNDPLWDPPSTYAGEKVTLEYAMNVAYLAGFRTEEQLLASVGVVIGESDLWTAARNWHPERGYRPATDAIGVKGPAAASSPDGRQMHSDRGMYQLSSYWWPNYTDEDADNPLTATAAFFKISDEGTDFTLWDSFRSGRVQSHYDQPYKGQPALRPIVRNFLSRVLPSETLVSESVAEPDNSPAATAEIAVGEGTGETTADSRPSDSDRSYGDPGPTLIALQQAADAGDGWAQIGLAEVLIKGEGTTADPQRAIALLEKAADAGLEGPALGTLGAYYRSIGDHQRALAALEDAAAANNGWAEFRLADMLIKGEGTAPDPQRAIVLLERATEEGVRGPAFKALGDYYLSTGDPEKAVNALTQATEAGEAAAKLVLADLLIKGEGTVADPARAVALLEQAAEAGLKGPALGALGIYYRGAGETGKALAALNQAVDVGDDEAKLVLADMLIKGEGTVADPSRAVALLEQVAKAGLKGSALAALGTYYRSVGDTGKALAALNQAADVGDDEAKLVLADMLIKGEGTSADPSRAVTLLEQAAEADLKGPALAALGTYFRSVGDTDKALGALNQAVDVGGSEAKLLLADMLIKGEGTTVDSSRAVTLLEQAAEAGLKGPALRSLGIYYRSASETGKAVAVLNQAVDAGDPQAKLVLATMLINGEGTKPDPERAIDLLEQAGAAGLKGPAFKALGDYYLSISHTTKAASALEQAADAGVAEAKVTLAGMLIKGERIPADIERAIALLEQAAEAGLKGPAGYILGMHYRDVGDTGKALAALSQAVDAGDAEAKLVLADMLITGEGTTPDPDRAIALLEQAAATGRKGPALMALAGYYRNTGNQEKAFVALRGASDAGAVEAKLALAEMLIKGEGTTRDPELAITLLGQVTEPDRKGPALKALGDYYLSVGEGKNAATAFEQAADAGITEANLVLADMLLKGEYSTADSKRMVALLEQAAEAGSKGPALSMLGSHYRSIGETGKALTALNQAVDAGDASAKLVLADMLIKGEGTKPDPERAIVLLGQAAGPEARAFATLGDYYRSIANNGETQKAIGALEAASDAGVAEAKLVLADLLIKGKSTKRDPGRAIALLEQAAEAGQKGPAFKALAEHYLGIGDQAKAKTALQHAADAGDGWAKVELAGMLMRGTSPTSSQRPTTKAALSEVTEVDRQKARMLLESALNQDRNPRAYVGLIELAAAEFRNNGTLEVAVSLLKDARTLDAAIALNSFVRLELNDKTAVVQAILRDKNLYSGPTNGRLNGSTLKAIGKFCSQNDIAECKSEAVPVALLGALLSRL